MKLLVVSSWCPWPPDNGSKLRAYHLLRQLSSRHEITLLSFAAPGDGAADHALLDVCQTVRLVPGEPFKPAGSLPARGLFARMPRSYAQTFSHEMKSLVRASIDRHDLAIGLQIGAAIYLDGSSPVPRVFEEAEVATVQDEMTRERHPARRVRRHLTWWKLASFIRQMVNQFDRTTVVSEMERTRLGQAGCDLGRIAVVPNGADAPQLSEAPIGDPNRLIYPGSVTYSANHDAVRFFAAEILPLVHRSCPEAVFHVTGRTQGVRIADMTGSGRVTFTGHLSEVDTMIAGSGVCVVPLRFGGGTRLKILQAMALGTPVVSTPKGAEGLDVSHGRDILIASTPEEFAAAVTLLLRDPEMRARLAQAGRALVHRRYTWDRVGQQLEAVLQEAVATRRVEQV